MLSERPHDQNGAAGWHAGGVENVVGRLQSDPRHGLTVEELFLGSVTRHVLAGSKWAMLAVQESADSP
jgi:hypothetical protein